MKSRKILNLCLTLCTLLSSTNSQWAFPKDFKFGVATSTYQVEGGWNADGKGVNNWDVLTHQSPSLIADGSNGDVACDSYHNWERDIEMVKETGVNLYRFSLSWTRIFPQGFINYVNPAGVDYYNNLINRLLENGIQPVITLFHWDVPQTMEVLKVTDNSILINFFGQYARKAFELFGDRVKLWITINEPKSLCQDYNAFVESITPVYPSGVIEYLCTYNFLRAHAEAYHIYQTEFKPKQKGRISITLNFDWSEPASNSKSDREAAEQRRQFEFGIFANPILNYDYPQIVKDRVANRSRLEGFPESRLPEFTLLEKLKLAGSYDFLGLNHYTTWYVEAVPDQPIGLPSFAADMGTNHFQDSSWPSTGSATNKVVPWGLRKVLQWIKQTYRNPEILITECGVSDTTGTLEDEPRIDFYRGYLNATLQAIHEDRVNVKAFTMWSLMDNWEWFSGYTVKFGLFYVDFNDDARPRTAKQSVQYIRQVVETRLIN